MNLLYFHRICLRTLSVTYGYRFSKSKFAKTIRHILKVKKNSDRARFHLSKNIFTFNFCQVVYDTFDSKTSSKYGPSTEANSMKEQY